MKKYFGLLKAITVTVWVEGLIRKGSAAVKAGAILVVASVFTPWAEIFSKGDGQFFNFFEDDGILTGISLKNGYQIYAIACLVIAGLVFLLSFVSSPKQERKLAAIGGFASIGLCVGFLNHLISLSNKAYEGAINFEIGPYLGIAGGVIMLIGSITTADS